MVVDVTQVEVLDANGDELRRLRVLQGYSLRDLAEKAGVTQDNIWKIERGVTRRPHGKTLRKLAEALGVSVAELLMVDGDVRG